MRNFHTSTYEEKGVLTGVALRELEPEDSPERGRGSQSENSSLPTRDGFIHALFAQRDMLLFMNIVLNEGMTAGIIPDDERVCVVFAILPSPLTYF